MHKVSILLAFFLSFQGDLDVSFKLSSEEDISLYGKELTVKLYGVKKFFLEKGIESSSSKHGLEVNKVFPPEYIKSLSEKEVLDNLVAKKSLDFLEGFEINFKGEEVFVITLMKNYESATTQFKNSKEKFQLYDFLFFVVEIEGFRSVLASYSRGKKLVRIHFKKE